MILPVIPQMSGRVIDVATRYASDLGSIELVGIGAPQEDGICWTPDGRYDSKLTAMLRRALETGPTRIERGRKLRFLFFKFAVKKSDRGELLPPWASSYPISVELPSRFSVVAQYFPEPDRKADFSLAAYRYGAISPVIPLEGGRWIVHQGVRWWVRGIDTERGQGRPGWTTIDLRSQPLVDRSRIQFFPIDRQGRIIDGATPDGRPISGVARLRPFMWSSDVFPAPILMSENALFTGFPGAGALSTPLYPELVSGIRLRRVDVEGIRFRGVPLEPGRGPVRASTQGVSLEKGLVPVRASTRGGMEATPTWTGEFVARELGAMRASTRGGMVATSSCEEASAGGVSGLPKTVTIGSMRLTLEGACRIDGRGAEAWDLTGRPDPDLTKLVKPAAAAQIWRGKKIRYAIFRETRPPNTYSGFAFPAVPLKLSLHYLESSRDGLQETRLVPMLAESGDRFGKVDYELSVGEELSGTILFRKGAGVRLGSWTYRIKGIEPVYRGERLTSPSGRSWIVEIEVSPKPKVLSADYLVDWRGIGVDGLTVRGVVGDGSPFLAPANIPVGSSAIYSGYRIDAKYAPAAFVPLPMDPKRPELMRLTTNIAPGSGVTLRAVRHKKNRVVFERVPLGPVR